VRKPLLQRLVCSVGGGSAGDDVVPFAASLAYWLNWLHAAGCSVAHWLDTAGLAEKRNDADVPFAVARLNSERPDDIAARSDAQRSAVAGALDLAAILDNKQACLVACLLRLVACLSKQANSSDRNLQASQAEELCLLECLIGA
jgi:hypothetical protein